MSCLWFLYDMKTNFLVKIKLVIFFFNLNCPVCSCRVVIFFLILTVSFKASGKWILYVTACDRCDAEDHSNLCQVYFDNFFFLFYKHYSSNRAHVLIVKLHHWLFPWNLRYLWRKNILLIWQGNSEFVLFDLAKYISIRKKCSWIILIFILYFSYNPDYDSEVSYGEV